MSLLGFLSLGRKYGCCRIDCKLEMLQKKIEEFDWKMEENMKQSEEQIAAINRRGK